MQRAPRSPPRSASRVAAPPVQATWRSAAAAGRDRLQANRSRRGPPPRCRSPSRHDRAVSARITASRSLPRRPVPGASPLPIGGSPFDGRYSGWGFSSIHGSPSSSAASPPHDGDQVRDHQIRRQLCQLRRVEHRHARGTLMDLRPGIGVVVDLGRVQTEEFDRVDAGLSRHVQPFRAGQKCRRISRWPESEGTARWPERRARDRVRRPPRRAFGLPCHSVRP